MYDEAIQNLINELGRLPGIGPKSAQRICFWLLDQPAEDVNDLIEALRGVKEKVRYCSICFTASVNEVCRICSDPQRDRSSICVVEESQDVMAIERTREFRGLYHVLGGSISPLAGRGPAELHLKELLRRLADEQVHEVILAVDPDLEGEATATYIARLLRDLEGVKVSRLASGLPVGGDLEAADEVTLGRAFSGRLYV